MEWRMRMVLNERLNEILHITQEECAEVTQAISKIFRFGFTETHNGKTNKEHLEEEIGDLECMIELLKREYAVDLEKVEIAKMRKAIKLNTWSTHIKINLEEV
jgi:NTP pyrophosphatase (non-canonical NTP hydrolase)